MNDIPEIKLYGTDGCHKTNYYKKFLDKTKLPYQFLDVEKNKNHAQELCDLYENPKKPFCKSFINPKLQLLLKQFSRRVDAQKLNHLSDEEYEISIDDIVFDTVMPTD